MSVLKLVGNTIHFQGPGEDDYLCGRCSRLLSRGVEQGQIVNLWIECHKCKWLNGFDMDLGWARYVIDELKARELSLERIAALIRDLKDHDGTSATDFLARNPDVAEPVAWIARISPALLLTLLTLIYAILSGERDAHIAESQLKIGEQQVEIARQDAEDHQITAGPDGGRRPRRIATELHALQAAAQLKPPPPSPRKAAKAKAHKKRR